MNRSEAPIPRAPVHPSAAGGACIPLACIPLIVGITGHRDLRAEDEPGLVAAVTATFAQLRAICPGTPLTLLSPLAEGADRLVARVALEAGAQLVVPLPFAIEEYERDFEHPGDAARSAASKQEFEALLARASHVFEVPLAHAEHVDDSALGGTDRDRRYARLGAYIVRNCHLLIALWDGGDSEDAPIGGTAHVVQYRLHGAPAVFLPHSDPLDAIDTGPLLHIATPRQSRPNSVQPAYSRRLLSPTADGTVDAAPAAALAASTWGEMFARLSTYNEEAVDRGLHVTEASLPSHADGLHADVASRALWQQFAVADALSQFHQRRRRQVLMALCAIAVLAVLCFELYSHLEQSLAFWSLYPCALAAGILVHRIATRRDFHNRHLDYRALAEGLRVQAIWHTAGMSDEVADHYLRKQRTELEWVRAALRAWLRVAEWRNGSAGRTRVQPLVAIAQEVLPNWVSDQRAFYFRASTRDGHRTEARERLAMRLLMYSLFAGIAVVALQRFIPASLHLLQHLLILSMGLAPAIAAAMSSYAEKMVYAPQAKRYRWMGELFERAEGQLKAAIKSDDATLAQRLVLELGMEALAENGDWVLMHRDRPPEAPKGG